MELKINISQRDLSFEVDNKSGHSLEELVKIASDKKIKLIRLSGESKSYTFLRQIALFINLTTKLNDCDIVLKSQSFKQSDKLIAPIYG